LYLHRSEISADSKPGVRGHFYTIVDVGPTYERSTKYKLQISSFTQITALVGTNCGLNCDVTEKLDADSISYNTQNT